MGNIEMTIYQLQDMLDEQKRITVEKCLSHNYCYNKESIKGVLKSLPIDEDKFRKNGMNAGYPNDFEVLKKFIK